MVLPATFDRHYDFSTYSVKGDCQKMVVRHLALLGTLFFSLLAYRAATKCPVLSSGMLLPGEDLFCNKAAVASLRTVVPGARSKKFYGYQPTRSPGTDRVYGATRARIRGTGVW
eukprot:2609551-Rhodomonas_salina.3